jgi:serine/threonine protein kinase
MRGLASGLKAIHDRNVRHGDLKPENILRFSDRHSLGHLVIADLGLAKTHVVSTRHRSYPTRTISGTARYEPPEASSNHPQARSRRYDVWSMGCILLEFLVWIIHGRVGLARFNASFDTFTNFKPDAPLQLHEKAQIWVDWMRGDPRCGRNTALGDLLTIITKRLLVDVRSPDNSIRRGDSSELYKRLEEINRRCKFDTSYLVHEKVWRPAMTKPRPLYHPPTESMSAILRPRPKALRLPIHMRAQNSLETVSNIVSKLDHGYVGREVLDRPFDSSTGANMDSETTVKAIISKRSEPSPTSEPYQLHEPVVKSHGELIDSSQPDLQYGGRTLLSTEESEGISSSEDSWSAHSEIGFESITSVDESASGNVSVRDGILESLMKAKKADVTEKTISWFTARVDSGLTVLAYQQGESSSSGQGIRSSIVPGKQSSQGLNGRKRRIDEDDSRQNGESEEGDGDKEGPNEKDKKKAKMTLPNDLKLACPFFKQKPELYKSRRTCCGPGWCTVHRVKYDCPPSNSLFFLAHSS